MRCVLEHFALLVSVKGAAANVGSTMFCFINVCLFIY